MKTSTLSPHARFFFFVFLFFDVDQIFFYICIYILLLIQCTRPIRVRLQSVFIFRSQYKPGVRQTSSRCLPTASLVFLANDEPFRGVVRDHTQPNPIATTCPYPIGISLPARSLGSTTMIPFTVRSRELSWS